MIGSNMKQSDIYIYGKHAVAEAMTARPEVITGIFFSHEFEDSEMRAKAKSLKVPVEQFAEKKMPGGLSKEVNHQGVVASLSSEAMMIPYRDFINGLSVTPNTALVVLGEVQDPHNVGAVIRSAAAFGIAGVLMPPHRQAPITGTVVKVSAGMAFRVPLVSIGNVNTTIEDLKERGFWTYGLSEEGSTSLYEEDFSKPTVFILGNEGKGLREKTAEACDTLVSVPMHPRAESLNASASAAVTFSHWNRQHLDALM